MDTLDILEHTSAAPRLAHPHHLPGTFETFALATPNAVALDFCDGLLTYAELNAAANALAHRLLALDLKVPAPVGIWFDRSPEAIVAMLAVLKAGHTYLPLDATYPVSRIVETLEDAQASALIADRTLAASLPPSSIALLFPDEPHASTAGNPHVTTKADDPAYLLYTSGSTGKPKGVLVSRANLAAFLGTVVPRFAAGPEDTWAWFHSAAFDFSVLEIFGALCSGARLVIVPAETTRDPEALLHLIVADRVTILGQTPTAFTLLNQAEARSAAPLSLRILLLAGEALQFPALQDWFTRHPDTAPRIVNGYGPTETTVGVTFRDLSAADAASGSENLIGQPLPGVQVHLLDDSLLPVLPGQPGELCVGGTGVSLGYLNRPELTAARFVPDPTNAAARIYRTGDLARLRADGELIFLGRVDDQVKVSGYRVELGEVQAALCRFPGIVQGCVVPHTGASGRTQLAAYYVESPGASVAVPQLALFLARNLPPQMLPAFYTRVAAIPVTANGKTDRKALPAPSNQSLFDDSTAREPSSELEAAVLALARKTLGVDGIGLDDNFFSVGGYSLLGTQFVLRARETFGVKITLADIFETESIAEIAQRVEQLIFEEIESLTEEEAELLVHTGKPDDSSRGAGSLHA